MQSFFFLSCCMFFKFLNLAPFCEYNLHPQGRPNQTLSVCRNFSVYPPNSPEFWWIVIKRVMQIKNGFRWKWGTEIDFYVLLCIEDVFESNWSELNLHQHGIKSCHTNEPFFAYFLAVFSTKWNARDFLLGEICHKKECLFRWKRWKFFLA